MLTFDDDHDDDDDSDDDGDDDENDDSFFTHSTCFSSTLLQYWL